MERVIGIDLGTTNSCVAIVEGGHAGRDPEPRRLQDHALDGRDHRGRQAPGRPHRQAPGDHQRREHGLRGQAPDRPQVELAAGARTRSRPRAYTIVEGPHDDVRIKLRDKMYSVPGDQRDDPAGDEAHRRGVPRRAGARRPSSPCRRTSTTTSARRPRTPGAIAGLDVIRIINEPTAAALAYGFGKQHRAHGRGLRPRRRHVRHLASSRSARTACSR